MFFEFYIGIVSWILSHTYLMNKSHGKIGWLNSEGLCFMGSEGCGPGELFCFYEPTYLAYDTRHLQGSWLWSVFTVYATLCAVTGVTMFLEFMIYLIISLIHFFGSKFLR